MVTFFTTTKNFTGIFDVIQNNALKSWRAISSELQIIIIGNSEGSKEAADSINADFVPEVRCSLEGTPFLNDLFHIAEKMANHKLLCYINADIILPKNFLQTINNVAIKFNKFLMVGHRWDMDVITDINFLNQTENDNFWIPVNEKAKKHACTGIDYFVFTKGQFKYLPDFIIGRWGWDNWLIWKTRRQMIPVIDATEDVKAIHQNHNYDFHHLKGINDSKMGDEAQENKKIFKDKHLNILDSTHILLNNEIYKKNDAESRVRYLYRLPNIFPEFKYLIKLYRRFYIKFLLK